MATGKAPEFVRLGESEGPGESTRDLRGYRVFDRAGVEVGVVENMLLDAPAQLVRLLRICPRDPLDGDAPPVLVPVEIIDRLEPDRLFLDAMRERILSAPPDDPAARPTADRWDGLYRYYGVAPFWADADEAVPDR